MSASKYAGLPDIDTAPDVYETPDPDLLPSPSYSDNDESASLPKQNEAIDGSALPALREAGKRFRGKRGGERGGDPLSSHLPPSSEYALLPRGGRTARPTPSFPRFRDHSDSDDGEHESPLDRLRRLRFEIGELEKEIGELPPVPERQAEAEETEEDARRRRKAPGPTPADMLNQLVSLRTDLIRLSTTVLSPTAEAAPSGPVALLGRLGALPGELPNGAASHEPAAVPDGAPVTDNKLLAEADRRIGELEKAIGAGEIALNSESATPFPTPLLPTLLKLEHQLTLLTQPRHLDAISRRLKLLNSELERASESRRKLGLSPADAPAIASTTAPAGGASSSGLSAQVVGRIDSLFELLPRLDPLLPLAPHLLERLRSLATLHASAAGFAGTLAGLERDQASLADGLRGLEVAVKGVEGSLAENEVRVKSNVEGLAGRVEALEGRMKALGGP